MAELEVLKNIVDNIMMMKIGTLGVAIIRRRVREGKFLPGSSEGADTYSSKPFAMPFGGLQTSVLKNKISAMEGAGAPGFFISKSTGNIWIVLKGGYKQLREIAGKQTTKVTLTWSGRMMRNLNVLPDTATKESVHIGFQDEISSRIAGYHDQEGAGKSKRLHKFLDFTEEEKNKLSDLLGTEIANKLVRL